MSVVAIMTRSPSDPRIKLRLVPRVPSEQARRELALAFLDDIADRCEALPDVLMRLAVTPPVEGLRVHRPCLSAESIVAQRGSALGERLQHVCEDLAASGFGSIVLIGSDLPDLPVAHLEQAFALLREPQTAVVGPSDDGACYLIGLTVAPGAVPDVFSSVRWESPHSQDDLCRALARAGLTVKHIRPWNDVDTPHDLDQLAGRLRYAPDAAPHTAAVLRRLGLF
jgi:rSAM/selenodomain-associated transferase 1